MPLVEQLLMRVRPLELRMILKRLYGARRRVTKTLSGETFLVDPISHFGNELLQTHTYEPGLTKVVQCLLRAGDTFVDAGANEGYFSVVAKGVVANGRVIAFEPQSRLLPVIEQNLKLNGCLSVELLSLGLSDREGNATLFLASDINSGASSVVLRSRVSRMETIQLGTLDSLLNARGVGKVRLLKIDCEGVEGAIIRGAKQLLRERKIEFISMDYHVDIISESEVIETDSLLRACGYELTELGS